MTIDLWSILHVLAFILACTVAFHYGRWVERGRSGEWLKTLGKHFAACGAPKNGFFLGCLGSYVRGEINEDQLDEEFETLLGRGDGVALEGGRVPIK